MVDLASHTILQSFDKDFAKLFLYQMFFLLTQANRKYPSCFLDINDMIAAVDFDTKNDSLQPIKDFFIISIFLLLKAQ